MLRQKNMVCQQCCCSLLSLDKRNDIVYKHVCKVLRAEESVRNFVMVGASNYWHNCGSWKIVQSLPGCARLQAHSVNSTELTQLIKYRDLSREVACVQTNHIRLRISTIFHVLGHTITIL